MGWIWGLVYFSTSASIAQIQTGPDTGLSDETAPEPSLGDLVSEALVNACHNDSADACSQASRQHFNRLPQDMDVAFDLAARACTLGDARECGVWAWYHDHGIGTDPQHDTATVLYADMCAAEPTWCHVLGRRHEFGEYVPIDYVEASRLYRTSCEANSPYGCTLLGRLEEFGKTGAVSLDSAMENYQLGCAGGDDLGCDAMTWLCGIHPDVADCPDTTCYRGTLRRRRAEQIVFERQKWRANLMARTRESLGTGASFDLRLMLDVGRADTADAGAGYGGTLAMGVPVLARERLVLHVGAAYQNHRAPSVDWSSSRLSGFAEASLPLAIGLGVYGTAYYDLFHGQLASEAGVQMWFLRLGFHHTAAPNAYYNGITFGVFTPLTRNRDKWY